jgi:hypothetical protein
MSDIPIRNRTHFIGIFVIAMAVLAYQILLTRIFSVAVYYHFAFAGISLAMFGLTAGAQRVYFKPERFTPATLETEWAKAALGFSISSVALVLFFLYSPLLYPGAIRRLMLPLSLLLFLIPFLYSGICVTLILTKSSSPTGRLYAADLVGAALGCIGIVGALFFLDPITIIMLLSSLCAFTAWLLVRASSRSLARCSIAVGCIMCCAALVQGDAYLSDHPHLKVMWTKTGLQKDTIFERWNAFSRVRVTQCQNAMPFGWGFGIKPTKTIDECYLDIDADAGTNISHFNGDLKPLSFLADDVINVGYLVRPIKDVAVIGVGGGRDVMSALYFKAHEVTGLELNPSIVEAMTKRFAEFTGYFYKRPDVKLINAEARSWLNQSHQTFDLVQISLIDTWAATAAGGLTLSENRLYTVEAWKEFLEHLNPGGELVVSRWFDEKAHIGEFYRLLSLGAESLKGEGIAPDQVRQHILAFNEGHIVTVVISSKAFSQAEVKHAHQLAKEKNYTVLMAPDFALDEPSRVIASGAADQAFYQSLPIDVTPPTDNRPFFFLIIRLKDMLFSHVDLADNGSDIHFGNNMAVFVIFFLVGGLFISTLAFVIEPLTKLPKDTPRKGILPHIGYFSAIGLGFMLIEISQMQRLMIFLGHPVFGLSVVLFTLLLFGGLGSFTVSPKGENKSLWLRPLLLCLVLGITGLLTPTLTEQLKTHGIALRIVASIAILAPAGFCMGMMFPLGMRMSRHYNALQPWLWSVNGATSAFASVLGMAISMEYGISAAYWCGVFCYAVCMVFAWRNEQVEI